MHALLQCRHLFCPELTIRCTTLYKSSESFSSFFTCCKLIRSARSKLSSQQWVRGQRSASNTPHSRVIPAAQHPMQEWVGRGNWSREGRLVHSSVITYIMGYPIRVVNYRRGAKVWQGRSKPATNRRYMHLQLPFPENSYHI